MNLFPPTRKPDTFWEIVGDLKWRLDDGRRRSTFSHEPEFQHGSTRHRAPIAWPAWATHLVAFLAGGLVWGAVVVAHPIVPAVGLVAILGFVVLAYRRRWR
jgi:hypothetical protein